MNRTSNDRRRPSASMAVAFVALFAALAGGAIAAKVEKAPKNSVVSKSIVKKAIKAKHLAPGAVKAPAIAPGAVGSEALAPGALGGAANVDVVTVNSAATTDADGVTNGGQVGIAKATATCPAGSVAIGGGAKWVDASSNSPEALDRNTYVQEAHLDGSSYVAEGIVDFGAQGNIKLQAQAYCLS